MAWHRIGDKPLSEPMLNRFTNAHMQHYGEMSLSASQQFPNSSNQNAAKLSEYAIG